MKRKLLGATILTAVVLTALTASGALQAAPVPARNSSADPQPEESLPIRPLADSAAPKSRGMTAGPLTPDSPNAGAAASQDATADGIARVEDIERSIGHRYEGLSQGARLQRWVALSMSGTDTDYRPDLSRNAVLAELSKEPVASAMEIQSALGAIPAGPEAHFERDALLNLADRIGSNPAALPTVETIIAAEAMKGISAEAPEEDTARLTRLLDSYQTLIGDNTKVTSFIDGLIQRSTNANALQLLNARRASVTPPAPGTDTQQAAQQADPQQQQPQLQAQADPQAPAPQQGQPQVIEQEGRLIEVPAQPQVEAPAQPQVEAPAQPEQPPQADPLPPQN